MFRHAALAALAFALGFFHAAFWAQHRLADELPEQWQGVDIEVTGVVAELPRQREGGLGFAFDVENVRTPGAHVPAHILLSTYDHDGSLPLKAGERWQFTVRLKQPHGTANPYGFDFEAWMLERNLRAGGYVRASEQNARLTELVNAPDYWIERLREKVRERFQRVLGDAPYTGVLAALAIGDQGSIPAAQWQVFTRTGVNHLMSISGPAHHHVRLARLCAHLCAVAARGTARPGVSRAQGSCACRAAGGTGLCPAVRLFHPGAAHGLHAGHGRRRTAAVAQGRALAIARRRLGGGAAGRPVGGDRTRILAVVRRGGADPVTSAPTASGKPIGSWNMAACNGR